VARRKETTAAAIPPAHPAVAFIPENLLTNARARRENDREGEIATYKTRAELIRENPVREGEEDFLRSARVCAILGISSTTLSRWNTEKPPRIPFIRLSKGNYRWRKSDVEAYMVRQRVDRRKVDRRSDNIESPIQRRTADRRSVDRL
jgi:predicted DNA-binding transcriptional regulator AlpA